MDKIVIKAKINKSDYESTSVRLPRYMIEYYDALADRTNRSRNELIELVLGSAMDNITVEELDPENPRPC